MATLLSSPTAQALTEWTGAGGDALWSNPANWQGNVIPGNTTGADLMDGGNFSATIVGGVGSASNPIVVDYNRTIRYLEFALSSDNYVVGSKNGNTLNLTTGGNVSMVHVTDGITATINAPVSILGENATYRFTNESGTSLSPWGTGTLVFGGPISGGTAGDTVLTLTGGNTTANTISGVISNGQATTMGITKSGAGTWVLTGANTYSGATNIDKGTLRIYSLAALGDGSATNVLNLNGGTLETGAALTVPASRTVNTNSSTSGVNTGIYDVTIAGTISGSGGLTKTGAGTLALTGAYNHTGPTTLSQGTLAVSSIGSGTKFVFAGGTLRYTGGNASWTRSYTINPATTATIDVSDRTANLTLSAASTATTGGLLKTGAGTLTIGATQAYTGDTTLRGGTLVLALGGGSNVVSSSSRLVLASGLLRFSGGGSQTFNNFLVNASSSTRVQVTDAQTLNLGQIAGTGSAQTVNFNLLGGTAVITGRTAGALIDPNWTMQDYSGFGLATVNASNQVVRLSTPLLPASGSSASTHYRIDNNNGTATTAGSRTLTPSASQSALSVTVDATTANGQMNLNSGVVFSTDLWNFGSVSSSAWYIVGSSGGAGIRTLTSGGTMQFNNWTTTGSRMAMYTPILDFGTSSALFMGSGTTLLAAANTYRGSTYVNGGILELMSGGSIVGTVSNSFVMGSAAGNESTFNLTGGTVSAGAEMFADLASAAGSIATANVSSGSWNSGAMRIGNGGTATLKITGGNARTYQGVVGYAAGSSGTVNISGGTWTNAPTVGGGAGGGTYIGESGTGVVNLSGTGKIDSDTVVRLGNQITGAGLVTMSGGTWTIRSGGLVVGYFGTGVFDMSGGVLTTSGNVQVGTVVGNGTFNLTGGTWTTGISDTVSVGDLSVFNLSGTGALSSGSASISGTANVSGGAWTINGTTPNSTTLVIYYSSSRGLNLTDSGVIALNANGVEGTGTVSLGSFIGSVGTINIGTGGVAGTLKAATVGGYLGAGVVNFNHTNDITFAPAITGNVSVNKQGSGTTTLTGNNNYLAATTVTAGTMLVSGSISGSPITVSNAGSTLGGTGTVANVTVNSGASLQGGDGVSATGALTSGGIVSLLDGSAIKLTLGTGGAHSSLARTGGLWSFDSDQAFTMNFAAPAETGFYNNIITGLAGNESGLATVSTWKLTNAGVVGTFTYDNAGGVDLTITAIPEPATTSLLTLTSLGLLGARRWRRRAGAKVA